MLIEQKTKFDRLIEQFNKETKDNIKMSLGVYLREKNTYYLIADTRSIREENGVAITNNDCVHKIVKLRKHPMAILNTGFNEFTKNRKNLEEYINDNLELYIDKIIQEDRFLNPQKIASKMSDDLMDSLIEYEKENKIPPNKAEYYRSHSNEIVFIFYDNGAQMNLLYKYAVRPFYGLMLQPVSIESEYDTCGYKQAEEAIKPKLENELYKSQDIIDFANQSYKEVFDNLPLDRKVINDKVDILKISGKEFQWIQRQ